ncbi:hypothetical protein Tco_1355678, partial [Tanacetum coccineum]
MERLIENLCTIWIGSFRLHANMVHFQRESKLKTSSYNNNSNSRNVRGFFPNVTNPGNTRGSFASILKEGSQKKSIPTPSNPALVIDDLCLKEQGFQSTKLTYLGGLWVLIGFDSLDILEKFRNHVGIRSWFSSIKPACNSFVSDERIVWVSVEGLPIHAWTSNTFSKIASKWGDLVVWEEFEEKFLSRKHICLKTKVYVIINGCFKIIINGKVYWIRAKELDAWVPKFFSDSDSSSSKGGFYELDEGSKFEDMKFDNVKRDNDVEKVLETSGMQENKIGNDNEPSIHGEENLHSSDPFNIY